MKTFTSSVSIQRQYYTAATRHHCRRFPGVLRWKDPQHILTEEEISGCYTQTMITTGDCVKVKLFCHFPPSCSVCVCVCCCCKPCQTLTNLRFCLKLNSGPVSHLLFHFHHYVIWLFFFLTPFIVNFNNSFNPDILSLYMQRGWFWLWYIL